MLITGNWQVSQHQIAKLSYIGNKFGLIINFEKSLSLYIHNNGAPRHAAIAIFGKPFLAIDKFEIKSSKQFPQARIVIPIEISERLNATPID